MLSELQTVVLRKKKWNSVALICQVEGLFRGLGNDPRRDSAATVIAKPRLLFRVIFLKNFFLPPTLHLKAS